MFEKVDAMTTLSTYMVTNVPRSMEDITLWSDIEEDCAVACHKKTLVRDSSMSPPLVVVRYGITKLLA